MALKDCPECGAQVSTQAMRCPQCGASGPQRSRITSFLFAAVILGALLIGGTMAILQAIDAGNAMR